MPDTIIDRDPEQSIRQKVLSVSERVVRGRQAADRWEVSFYRWQRVATATLSVLGGMGLAQVKPTTETLSWGNPAFGAGVAAIAVAIALELYKSFNLEEVAISSLSARDAFRLVAEDIDIALQSEDPMPQLNAVTEQSKTLARNFYKVIPGVDVYVSASARDMCDSLINRNKHFWRLPDPPKGE